MLSAAVPEFDFSSHGGQELARGLDVAHLRNVFEDDRFVREQSGGHRRKGGVFGAADPNCPKQRIPAANYEFIHNNLVPWYTVSNREAHGVRPFFDAEIL